VRKKLRKLILAAAITSLIIGTIASGSCTNNAASPASAATTAIPAAVTAAAPPNASISASPLSSLAPANIQIARVFPNLSFPELTNLAQPKDQSGLIFITEQKGIVESFLAGEPQKGSTTFLDITSRVNRGGTEEGLLGLAFDPNYQENGYFYLYYSAANPRRSVISRFTRSQVNPASADPASEVIIMEIDQPFANHNGGQLTFGPDGNLYIGLGDGGGAGDPQGNGQNLNTLLGSILRIDVKGLSEKGGYKIPPDNPFVNRADARPEIWAYGLRNPWRFSFDRQTGLLWAGDVGQDKWEEIDIITKGANYGWNIMEGFHCYSPSSGCNQSGLTLPLAGYDHSQGCSVTGGYVYRGDKVPSLTGYYIYGDYCSGNIWALLFQNNAVSQNTLLLKSGLAISSFGEDQAGNFYILAQAGGIYTLVPK
jgi:glucose/arabinose dehydrogenase